MRKTIIFIYKLITRLIIFTFILALIAFGCLYYAFKIEPYNLVVNKFDINKSQESSNSFTIAQFSDIHIKEDYTVENFSKVVDEINNLSPDFVIFTGDLYDNYSIYKDDKAMISELDRISAKVAKIAIRGNRDYGGTAEREYHNIMEKSGFNLLTNQNEMFTINDKNILITGIDDSMLGNPFMPKHSFENIDYSIFLTHEPDVIDRYDLDEYGLILSGHTHGGQIKIPLFPSINKYALQESALSSNHKSGLTKFDNSYLYVNTGIGTTHISARFMVVPEISHFTIYL